MWDHTLRFSVAPLEELSFWNNNIDSFKGYSLRQLVSLVLLGRHNGLGYVQVWRPWSELHVLQVESYLLSSIVLWEAAVAEESKCFHQQSRSWKKRLLAVPKSTSSQLLWIFFSFVFQMGSPLKHSGFPGRRMRADLLGRFIDEDNWCINPSVFCLPDAKWGPHTFDCCATYYNAQLPGLTRSLPLPDSVGSTTLAQDWSVENNWMCAPVSIIVDSVCYLISCFGYRTLIIPKWPST